MKYLIAASDLTKPTVETLKEQVNIRFKKIERLASNLKIPNVLVKISVRKEGKTFYLTLEAKFEFAKKELVVKEKGTDLRRIVSLASQTLKTELLRQKELAKDNKIKRGKFHKNLEFFGT